MNMTLKAVVSAVVLATLPMVVQAGENRPVTSAKQIVGCYERINFSPELMKQLNPVEPWIAPYQWFCFEPNGKLSSMMSSEYEKHTAKELRSVLGTMPTPFTYQYVGNNSIRISDDAGYERYDWFSYFYTEDKAAPDGTVVKKGTLVMAVPDPSGKKVIYWRYLKPLK